MTAEIPSQDNQEFAINKLLAEFHGAVETTAANSEKYQQMLAALKKYNPSFEPMQLSGCSPKTEVLANVVAGIYAPLIHAYTGLLVKNTCEGNLPKIVIAPPRDAIPLANSIKAQAQLMQANIHLELPHVNRNTAGIANNQKAGGNQKSPYLDLLLDQTTQRFNGAGAAMELETGIYGTTSLVMARAFKERWLKQYFPIKFYGLGPNLSFVHGVLSEGKEWWLRQLRQKD